MKNILDNISVNYDNELKYSEKLHFEAIIAISENLRKLNNDIYFKYHLISKSINRVKRQISIQY